MRMTDVIAKKRDGGELDRAELSFWINGYVAGEIPDYQSAAMLMAIYIRGMSKQEIADMTDIMLHSGEMLDLSLVKGIKADKHSSGGVGDKTTLVLAPLVAAGGIVMAKMSGRGLGHTGGTIDKLESIPGFKCALSREDFLAQLNTYGLAIISQSGNLTPADKLLYALRDVTATVNSLPLIASSIMSKKLAVGADILVLDVKYGAGALLPEVSHACELAELMVHAGTTAGKKVSAVISSMDQPLGRTVGNALEVDEAMDVLNGSGPEDLRRLCCVLAGEIFYLADKVSSRREGAKLALNLLNNGQAYEKFREMVSSQGGDVRSLTAGLTAAKVKLPVFSPIDGFIKELDAAKIGMIACELGAGRRKKEDSIDHHVGISLSAKAGNEVKAGDVLATVFAKDEDSAATAIASVLQAYTIVSEPVHKPELVYGIVTQDGLERIDE